MTNRKKKILTIQLILLFFGIAMIYGTYYTKKTELKDTANLKKTENKSVKDGDAQEEQKDIFFNIEYTGSDLAGNRYVLKSEEAYLDEIKPEIVYMKRVNAIFYFKDNTRLYVWSDNGIYNNKSLDMKFEKDVKADYLENKLFADNAEYSNKKSFLSIYNNVKINSNTGNIVADKLLFDVKDKKLDISSFKDNAINVNVNLNEKRF